MRRRCTPHSPYTALESPISANESTRLVKRTTSETLEEVRTTNAYSLRATCARRFEDEKDEIVNFQEVILAVEGWNSFQAIESYLNTQLQRL